MNKLFKPKLILVAGGSSSGKTALTNIVKQKYFPDSLIVINYDDYYKKQDHLTLEQRNQTNYDLPTSLDNDLLLLQIKDLLNNKEVNKPIYDYAIHNRKIETETVYPHPLIILEGIFALYDQRIRNLSSLNIYIETKKSLRMDRKIERDILYRGRNKEYAISQFINQTEPAHELYVQPTKKYADTIISGEKDLENNANLLAKLIKEKVSKLLE